MNLDFELISYLKDGLVRRLYSYDEFMEAVANGDLTAETFVEVYRKNRPIERVSASIFFVLAENSPQRSEKETSDKGERSAPPSDNRASNKIERSTPPADNRASNKIERSAPPSDNRASNKIQRSTPPADNRASNKIERSAPPSDNRASDKGGRSTPLEQLYLTESRTVYPFLPYGQLQVRQGTRRAPVQPPPKPEPTSQPEMHCLDWQWISEIFGQDGIQVGADEFDHIVRKNSIGIYNIYLRNNLLVLEPYFDATAPTEARLLLLQFPFVSSAKVIPGYGFATRFANTKTTVANYDSTDVSTFFDMRADDTNQLKVCRPAFINFSGNELDVNSIKKGELSGFTR